MIATQTNARCDGENVRTINSRLAYPGRFDNQKPETHSHVRGSRIHAMRNTFRLVVIATSLLTLSSGRMTAQQSIPNPEQYFGSKIGSEGELARYPKILE